MEDQNTVIYLMFLNGVLFLGLNFIARSIIFPAPRASKKLGYVLIVSALSAFGAQQEYRALVSLGIESGKTGNILFGGFILPVFLISIVYYRMRRNRAEQQAQIPVNSAKGNHGND